MSKWFLLLLLIAALVDIAWRRRHKQAVEPPEDLPRRGLLTGKEIGATIYSGVSLCFGLALYWLIHGGTQELGLVLGKFIIPAAICSTLLGVVRTILAIGETPGRIWGWVCVVVLVFPVWQLIVFFSRVLVW